MDIKQIGESRVFSSSTIISSGEKFSRSLANFSSNKMAGSSVIDTPERDEGMQTPPPEEFQFHSIAPAASSGYVHQINSNQSTPYSYRMLSDAASGSEDRQIKELDFARHSARTASKVMQVGQPKAAPTK
ncbi:MAG: hypothetical protein LBI81_01845 [Puniceicoccales bacterium]|jgi:hypothetical protein|nr:hypothetical protein [Puniceicoccales bacterium]